MVLLQGLLAFGGLLLLLASVVLIAPWVLWVWRRFVWRSPWRRHLLSGLVGVMIVLAAAAVAGSINPFPVAITRSILVGLTITAAALALYLYGQRLALVPYMTYPERMLARRAATQQPPAVSPPTTGPGQPGSQPSDPSQPNSQQPDPETDS